MIITVASWLLVVVISIIFLAVTSVSTSDATPVFVASVLRDLVIINLLTLMIFLVTRSTKGRTTVSNKISTTGDDRQPTTNESTPRVHSRADSKDLELDV